MKLNEKIKSLSVSKIFKSILIVITIVLLIFDSLSELSENIAAETINYENAAFRNKVIFCDEIIDSTELDFIKEIIASTESQSGFFKPEDTMIYYKSWTQINKNTDAAGRYQFVRNTRISISKHLNEPEPNYQKFLKDRKMQDRYLIALFESNNRHFKEPIKIYDKEGNIIARYKYSAYEKFEGKVVNGYYISKSGMLLMSQAIGAQGTIDWLMGGCKPEKLPSGAPIADRRLSINIF
jgi:hypothetical protein